MLIDDLVAAHHLIVPGSAALAQLHGLGRAPCRVIGLALQRRLGAFDIACGHYLQCPLFAVFGDGAQGVVAVAVELVGDADGVPQGEGHRPVADTHGRVAALVHHLLQQLLQHQVLAVAHRPVARVPGSAGRLQAQCRVVISAVDLADRARAVEPHMGKRRRFAAQLAELIVAVLDDGLEVRFGGQDVLVVLGLAGALGPQRRLDRLHPRGAMRGVLVALARLRAPFVLAVRQPYLAALFGLLDDDVVHAQGIVPLVRAFHGRLQPGAVGVVAAPERALGRHGVDFPVVGTLRAGFVENVKKAHAQGARHVLVLSAVQRHILHALAAEAAQPGRRKTCRHHGIACGQNRQAARLAYIASSTHSSSLTC
ncbi:hypothetical protein D9M68_590210 [compost metagenome]